MNFDEMKNWYDGYMLPEAGHIYNPRSVIESLTRKKYGSYWTRTETYEALKIFLEMNFDGLKDSIIQMISGSQVHINTEKFQNDMATFKSKDDVLTLLVHLGYLAFNQKTSNVYIPNFEIQGEFNNAIEGEYWNDVIDLIKNSDELLQATWNGDSSKVAQIIDSVHMNNTSILSYNNENSLACVISMAYYNAVNYYTRIREFPTGRGFADVVFLPKRTNNKPAMIVELKYNNSTQGAINQIKEKHYTESLKDYKGNLLLVGINYDKKSGLHECIIEHISK
jgi:ribosomal protein S8